MREKVKRLQPTPETLRELYLKSGNQCAFPGCNNLIMNELGNFVGEVCHIEAAMPGGERFNPKQSNEERRQFSNLMLMCHTHHKVTDNVDKYTMEKLKKIKCEHEAKFTNIIKKISESIEDYTKKDSLIMPKTLQGMNEYFKWNQTAEELKYTIERIWEFGISLSNITRDIRNLLCIISERVEEKNNGVNSVYFKVPVAEIKKVCKLSFSSFRDNVIVLEKYGLCYYEKDWDGIDTLKLSDSAYDGWWKDLKEYCKYKKISLYYILVDLKFDLLD